MDIFIRNIPFACTRYDVAEAIANVLHSASFADLSDKPINFEVNIHRPKPHQYHGRNGSLLVPSVEIGNRFLQMDCGTRGLSVLGGLLRFAQSRNPRIHPVALDRIQQLPYTDPRIAEEEERRRDELKTNTIGVRVVQSCWETRDRFLSVEWEYACNQGGSLVFSEDRDKRELSIHIAHDKHTFRIAIPPSRIQAAYAHPPTLAIVLILNVPPNFEQEPSGPAPADGGKSPLRRRLPCLPFGDHKRVAPYTSLAFRFLCHEKSQVETFRKLYATAQFPRTLFDIGDSDYPTVRRDLFTQDILDLLERWKRSFKWPIAFQVEALVKNWVLDPREMIGLMLFVQRLARESGTEIVATSLRTFRDRLATMWSDEEEEWNLEQILTDIYSAVKKQAVSGVTARAEDDPNTCNVYHVNITPTSMLLDGPSPEQSNRIIRKYDKKNQESFLRVSFKEEGNYRYRLDRDIDSRSFVKERFGSFLLDGLSIAKRPFVFLAYSQSALKEHTVWFVKPFTDNLTNRTVTAESIIAGIGQFHSLEYDPKLLQCPARYAARLAQAFTATNASVEIEVDSAALEADISTEDGMYHFTDGVGTISGHLAQDIAQTLQTSKRKRKTGKARPKAFQIRFQGSKGMVSVDYRLEGRIICLRQSMVKFKDPTSTTLEIARAFDQPTPYYLNRPLIMILDGLGVPFEAFQKYQRRAIHEVNHASTSLGRTAQLLQSHGLGAAYRLPSTLLNLEKLYVESLGSNLFYRQILEHSVNHILREIKYHARIPIPNAHTLVGVADVHRFLAPNQIFACIKLRDCAAFYLEGPVLISRSPVIHPGDVQIVHAIGQPPPGSCFAREPIPNTVVFSILGERPVPSCLGGGDLDGDLYNLIPLDVLPEFTPEFTYRPASYEPAKKMYIDRVSTMEDVANFVMEYIVSDVLGIVATNWMLIADQSQHFPQKEGNDGEDEQAYGIFHRDCLSLAELHSNAVDYPKSGRPVDITDVPRPSAVKPDWNAPETVNADSGKYYPSHTALGRLFREVKLPAEVQRREQHHRRRRVRQEADVDGLIDNLRRFDMEEARENPLFAAVEARVDQYILTTRRWPESEMELVEQIYSRYCHDFVSICATHTLSGVRGATLQETEAVVGTISQKTSQTHQRKDMMSKLRERTEILARQTRESLAGDEKVSKEESLTRAWIAWEVSFTKGQAFGAQSFGWIALNAIFEAMKEIDELDKPRAHETWRR